ncbi:MAG TPA: M14 family metallopeptidase [Terriglobales bacterium]|jgi:murein tripeptide amidase MpaA|nr:M14 family metallopeptidase [Terriglobales bacterium]
MKKQLCFLLMSAVTCALAQQPKATPESKRRIVKQEADWRTPAEASNYLRTPRYEETMAYVRRVAAAAPQQVKLESFGKTAAGRDLVAVIVSRDGVFEPGALHRSGRPVVMIQNAIHAGEMDGKDACLALLRDMVVTKAKAALLEHAVVVIIPIYNADGHERYGPHNRINQNGPEETGWRVTAQTLNLNRDYVKADAPETRAWLKLWNRWLPDFFVDDHVTDGADYQYDVTYHLTTGPSAFPGHDEWLRNTVEPYLDKSVAAAGHVVGPLIFLKDDTDPSKGMERFPNVPRFADGYTYLQNRPGMLVEMHMLKDYKTRVTGNYEILRALLELVNREAERLVRVNREADAARIEAGKNPTPKARYPLRLGAVQQTEPFRFRGVKYKRTLSEVSGKMRIEYSGEPSDMTIPQPAGLEVVGAVAPPRAYIVPAQWTTVIDVLEAHGLRLLRTTREWAAEIETYRCQTPTWHAKPYEGRQVLFNPQAYGVRGYAQLDCKAVRERMSFPAGSVVVPLDQRAAQVAIQWLEPYGPDSALAWGLLNGIFEQKEYGEDYVLEKLAREMMARDPKLKQEFEGKIAGDAEFAASASARLNFFYQRSPWWDGELGLYPVGRLNTLEGIPLK